MDFIHEFYINKNLSLLKKITLIIPTFNRNYYFSRCLWYHAHFPFGEIIVADSSSDAKKMVNQKIVAKVREMFGTNIRYLEYEQETEKYGKDIYRKWGDAVQHVTTDYSIITTDKQFVFPLTLVLLTEFLDEHPDYNSAESKKIWIDKDSNGQTYFIPNGDSRFSVSITSDDSIERYKFALQYGTDTLFMLYRNDDHKKFYNYLMNSSVSDLRFAEMYLNIIPYIFGKSYFLDFKISLCRDMIHLNRNGKLNVLESSTVRYPSLDIYKKDGVYDEFYQNYKNSLLMLCNEIEVIDPMNVKNKMSLQNILLSNPKLMTVWQNIPKKLRMVMKQITGYTDTKIENISDEMMIVDRLVNQTNKFHNLDEPILGDDLLKK